MHESERKGWKDFKDCESIRGLHPAYDKHLHQLLHLHNLQMQKCKIEMHKTMESVCNVHDSEEKGWKDCGRGIRGRLAS